MAELRRSASNGMLWSGVMSFSQQVLGLFFTIVIARRLVPADYGMVGMLAIFSALATTLQDGGLIWALTNKENVTQKEYSTVFWFNIGLGALIYLMLFLSAPFLASYFGHSELIWLSRLVFLGIFISSFGIIQTAILYRELRVKERTIAAILSQVISGITGVVLAYNGFTYWGIAVQGVVLMLVNTIILWIYSPFRPSLVFDARFIKQILIDGVRFVIPNIFSIASENIFSFILGKKYTVHDVGNYSQATKWNTTGYSFVLNTMRNVSQPVLVQVRDDKEHFLAVFRKLFRMSAFLIIPIMLGLAMVAPEFISVLLTDKWLESSLILRVLCVGGMVSTLNTMFSYFIMSLNRTKVYMWMGILISVLNVSFAFIASCFGVIWLAYSYVLVSLISFLLYYFLIRQTHSYTLLAVLEDVLPILVVTIGVFTAVYFATRSFHNIFLQLSCRIVFSATLYLLCAKFLKIDSYIEIKCFISGWKRERRKGL